MKDKDIHKLIEQQNTEKKAAMYAEFQKKHNLTTERTVHQKKKHAIRIVSCATAALILICLIVAIPFMLKNNEQNSTRYCSINDCIAKDIEYTVKDYAANESLPLLYIDWYDNAEEIKSQLFVNKDDSNDVIYIHEYIANGETGDTVDLYIVKKNIILDLLVSYEENCDKTTIINGTSVKWSYIRQLSVAVFIFNDYQYCIQIEDPMEEESVLKIVEEMINR